MGGADSVELLQVLGSGLAQGVERLLQLDEQEVPNQRITFSPQCRPEVVSSFDRIGRKAGEAVEAWSQVTASRMESGPDLGPFVDFEVRRVIVQEHAEVRDLA